MIKKEEYSPQDLEADFLQQLRKQEEADILVLGHNPSSNGSKQPTVNQKKRHMWKYAIALVLVLIVVILAIVLLAVNALGGGDGDKTAVTTDPTTNGTGVLPPPDTTTRTPATSFTSEASEHSTSTTSTSSTSTTSTIPIPRVGEWVQQGLDIDGITEYAAAATSVSLSADGTILALGAYFNNGYAQVWEWNDTAWVKRGDEIIGPHSNAQSGSTVALSSDGSILAIGAPRKSYSVGSYAGLVQVWQWTGAIWVRRGSDIEAENNGDFSGGSVAISSDGNIIAIGASGNDGVNGDASGHVRVWEWSGTDWDQKGGDIDGEAEGDGSGSSVALSSDGLIVAVGASRNDVFGYDTGHVRVWEWSGTDWVQEGEDIDGEARGDYSGGAVALSSNGFDCRHWSQVQWRKWRTFRPCSYLGMVW